MPTLGPVEYSVESATTGRAVFTVSSMGSFGTAVSYSGSVIGGNGTVETTGNSIVVAGLDYTQTHTVVVMATSAVCPGVEARNMTFTLSFSKQ